MNITSIFKKLVVASLAAMVVVPTGASAALYGANNLLGQIEANAPYYTSGNPDDSANPRGFSQNSGTVIDTAGNRAFVADSGNNRVLVFNLNAGGTFVDRVADFVLGQPDFKMNAAGTSQNQLSLQGAQPVGLAFDASGQRLFVSDVYNNRVLVFDVAAITNGENAVNVLGQPDFVSSGQATTQNGFSVPAGLTYDASGQRLFVVDALNNRVLVFDVAAITNGENAVNVLGQNSFSTSTSSGDWSVAFDTPQSQLESFAIDSTNGVIYAGTGTMYSSPNSGLIYRCVLSTGCDAASDWTTSFNSPKRIIYSLTIDSTNGVIYAGTYEGGSFNGGTIYRCDTTSGCDANGDWTVSFNTPTIQVLALTFDSANGALYAGATNPGTIYRCDTASACDDAADWVSVFSGEAILSFAIDSTNGVIYAGSGYANNSFPSGVVYRCALSSGCGTPADWSVSIDTSESEVWSLAIDSTNGVLYAGVARSAANLIYRCDLSTGCDASGDWTVSLDSVQFRVRALAVDSVNGRVYAGSANDGALYQCPSASGCDASGDWTQVFNDPMDAEISELAIDSTNGVIYAGTGISQGKIYRCVLSTGCQDRLGINVPLDAAYDAANQRLFVSDSNNNRVVTFDVTTIVDGEAPVNVLGQPDLVSNSSNTTQNGLYRPIGLAYAANRLFVSDSNNNRVVTFDVTAITNGENAVNVLGQPDFVSNGGYATSQNTFSQPTGLAIDAANQRLYVNEAYANRVLVFDVAAVTNNENATDILGQTNVNGTPHYTNPWVNNSPGNVGFNYAPAVALDPVNDRLFVADRTNARVLVFNLAADNSPLDYLADFVLGQPDFKTNTPGTSQNTLGSADGLAYDQATQRLFVADASNNRVLVFNVAAITNGENAVNVLGQTNFTNNGGAATQNGMDAPSGLAWRPTNNELIVADTGNSRVLVFNVAAITNGENATDVLGQTNFTNNAAAVTQNGMDAPSAVVMNGANSRLFVSDSNNNRVLVFNTTGAGNGITNGENALNVLGQPNFVSNASNLTQNGMSESRGLSYDTSRNRLYVSDSGNHRVLTFDMAVITNGENAIDVFGQLDFVSGDSGVTPSRMSGPMGSAYDAASDRLILADANNHRVMFFNLGALVISPFSLLVGGPASTPLALSAETGETVAYDLALAEQPAARVTVTITERDPSNIATVRDQVIFTRSNWNVPRRINVRARRNARLRGAQTMSISHRASSSDPSFNNIAIPDVSVTVTR